jgi:hypothetical protein
MTTQPVCKARLRIVPTVSEKLISFRVAQLALCDVRDFYRLIIYQLETAGPADIQISTDTKMVVARR